MTKSHLYVINTMMFITYLTVVICISNITAVYLTGKNLSMKENLIIIGVSTFIWVMGSLFLYILTLESVKNGTQSKLLVVFEIIMLWLFVWPLGVIASLAFNDCSLDFQGVIEQVKKYFWGAIPFVIAYAFTSFNIIKAFIKAL